jgi:hypothetical protein
MSTSYEFDYRTNNKDLSHLCNSKSWHPRICPSRTLGGFACFVHFSHTSQNSRGQILHQTTHKRQNMSLRSQTLDFVDANLSQVARREPRCDVESVSAQLIHHRSRVSLPNRIVISLGLQFVHPQQANLVPVAQSGCDRIAHQSHYRHCGYLSHRAFRWGMVQIALSTCRNTPVQRLNAPVDQLRAMHWAFSKFF